MKSLSTSRELGPENWNCSSIVRVRVDSEDTAGVPVSYRRSVGVARVVEDPPDSNNNNLKPFARVWSSSMYTMCKGDDPKGWQSVDMTLDILNTYKEEKDIPVHKVTTRRDYMTKLDVCLESPDRMETHVRERERGGGECWSHP